jgi:hypothetical protein
MLLFHDPRYELIRSANTTLSSLRPLDILRELVSIVGPRLEADHESLLVGL